MVLMPASKLSRVRRLAFSNISTICLPSSACRYSRGLRFTSWASFRTARTSEFERSEIEQRSSPRSRVAAASISGSSCTETGAGARSRVRLAMGISSLGACRSLDGALREDFVQRGDGSVHVRTLENVRWEEAQHSFAGAVDQNVPL